MIMSVRLVCYVFVVKYGYFSFIILHVYQSLYHMGTPSDDYWLHIEQITVESHICVYSPLYITV